MQCYGHWHAKIHGIYFKIEISWDLCLVCSKIAVYSCFCHALGIFHVKYREKLIIFWSLVDRDTACVGMERWESKIANFILIFVIFDCFRAVARYVCFASILLILMTFLKTNKIGTYSACLFYFLGFLILLQFFYFNIRARHSKRNFYFPSHPYCCR